MTRPRARSSAHAPTASSATRAAGSTSTAKARCPGSATSRAAPCRADATTSTRCAVSRTPPASTPHRSTTRNAPTTVRDSGVPAIREAWFQHAVDLLGHPARGADARAYLESRGITQLDAITGLVGVAPHQTEAWRRLVRDGHEPRRDHRLGRARRLTHSRPRRWRLARSSPAPSRPSGHAAPTPTLPRASATSTRAVRAARLCPTSPTRSTASEVVIVEGVLDALVMRAHGHDAAVALGGSSAEREPPGALSPATVCATPGCSPTTTQPATRPAAPPPASLLRTDTAPRLSIRLAHLNAEHKDMADLLNAHPESEHRHGVARRVLRRLRRARDTQHPGRPRLEAKRAPGSVRPGHPLSRQRARYVTRSAARPQSERSPPGHASIQALIHAVTHTHEDASSLRERVRHLETAITTARSLIGDARLPTPTGERRAPRPHTRRARTHHHAPTRRSAPRCPSSPLRPHLRPHTHEPQHLPERSTR